MASKGLMKSCLSLVPAVKPETYTLPRLLLALCMTIEPMAVMEYCRPMGIPMAISIPAVFLSQCLSAFPI